MKKKILFKITGSIAAYKACYLISKLVQNNFEVQVVVSSSAKNFIGYSTLEGLTGNPVLSDLFLENHAMDHIHLIRSADLVLICPATANCINKIAHGIGDDLLTTLFLAHDFKKPYLIAPAMNTTMYMHPTTQDSLKKLKAMGVCVLETQSGVLACGETGWGKLLDPELIYNEIFDILNGNVLKKKNQKILITSGGTQEPIDAVRCITNLSTGKTGAFLADQFISAGYDITYLHGKTAVLPSQSCSTHEFGSFQSLQSLMKSELQKNNFVCVIHLAAVSDYSVESDHLKSKWPSDQGLVLHLKPNPKILNSIKSYATHDSFSTNPLVIGFKLTVNLDKPKQYLAVEKLFSNSNVDYVVQNDLNEIDILNQKHIFHIFQERSTTSKDCANKFELFENLLKIIETRCKGINSKDIL
jgi:phosphopantothenoylcysteine decarboxylase/phosphopantothenate--cysteine ligase